MGQLLEKIAAEIKDRGAISFARFMELALYCPVYGYYEKERDIGRRGDYYTSVSVGPLFGELLACQFARWLENSGPARSECQGSALECHGEGQAQQRHPPGAGRGLLVEAGAHRGDMARDILRWLRAQRPAAFERVQYSILEPSPARRDAQQQTLAEFEGRVCWSSSFSELVAAARTSGRGVGLQGVIFSNELLDAFPVHRLGWDPRSRAWFEWGVTAHGGELVWTRLGAIRSPQSTVHGPEPKVRSPKSEVRSPEIPEELLEVLPDGFTIEVSPAAVQWWSQAAGALASGKLLAIDYGLTTEELFSPARTQGTLRGYRQHQLVHDVLANPGEQDITAQVNFSALRETGEAAGLKTERFCSQAQWLTELASRIWTGEEHFGNWTSGYTRQFQTLTHPNHLGSRFRILVQSH